MSAYYHIYTNCKIANMGIGSSMEKSGGTEEELNKITLHLSFTELFHGELIRLSGTGGFF